MNRIRPDIHKIGKGWNAGGKTAKRWGRKNPVVVFAQRYPKEIKKMLRLLVVAREAAAVPPLGPTLGQYGIPIMRFCDQFNLISKKLKKKTELLVLLFQTYDNAFFFEIHPPTTSFLLKRVCGIKKGSGQAGQVFNIEYLKEYKVRKFYEEKNKQKYTGAESTDENKYSFLEKKQRKRVRRRRKKKKSRTRSYYTKYKNVVGRTRFFGLSPQMLYEVCLIKYNQYINGGLYTISMDDFNSLYTSEQNINNKEQDAVKTITAQNLATELKYVQLLNRVTTFSTNIIQICQKLMQSFFRRAAGTMRSMGLFLVICRETKMFSYVHMLQVKYKAYQSYLKDRICNNI